MPGPAAWARRYVGIPFESRGRDPAKGLDCWGLVRWVLADHGGLQVPSFADSYGGSDDGPSVASTIADGPGEALVRLPDGAPVRELDGVLIRIKGQPWHVGVIVGDNHFLHAADWTGGSVIERLDDPKWRARILGFWRHRAAP